MKKVREPTYTFVILTLGLIIINIILARLSVLAIPAGMAGVSTIYIAVAFMILFTLWFGAYGAIAAYAGTFVGSGLLSSIPPDVALYLVRCRPSAGSSSRSLHSGPLTSTWHLKTGGTGRFLSSSVSLSTTSSGRRGVQAHSL